MGKLVTAFAILLLYDSVAKAQYLQNFNNSPNNFNNSPYNFNNSPYNFNNSPNNFNNSPNNFGATNGIYSTDGVRQGYTVPRPDGGINYFDNNGNHLGYTPGQNGLGIQPIQPVQPIQPIR